MLAKEAVQAASAEGLLSWKQEGYLDNGIYQLQLACQHYLSELADHYKVVPFSLGQAQGGLKEKLATALTCFQSQGIHSGELMELHELLSDKSSWLSCLDNAFTGACQPRLSVPAERAARAAKEAQGSLGIPLVDLSTGLSVTSVNSWINQFQQLMDRQRAGMQEY